MTEISLGSHTGDCWPLLHWQMSSVLSASTNGGLTATDSSDVAPTQPDVMTPLVPAADLPTIKIEVMMGEKQCDDCPPLKTKDTEDPLEGGDCSPPYTQKDPVKRARVEELSILTEYEALLAAQRHFVERLDTDKTNDVINKQQLEELRIEFLREIGQVLVGLATKWKLQIIAQ
jgi:hypothetical protein